MISHIHYNGYFEFCRVSSVFFSSFFHKKYAPPKVSNFWGAYQIFAVIFSNEISPYPKNALAPAYVKNVRPPPAALITCVKLVPSVSDCFIPLTSTPFSRSVFSRNSPFSSRPILP